MNDTTTIVGVETEGDSPTVSDLIHGRSTAADFTANVNDVTPSKLADDLVYMLSTPEILLAGAKGEGVPMSQVMQAFVDVLVIVGPERTEELENFNNQIRSLRFLSGEVSLEDYFKVLELQDAEGLETLRDETQNHLDNPISLIMLSMGQKVEPATAFEKMGDLVRTAKEKLAA